MFIGEKLYYLSISAVFFFKCVVLLCNYRKQCVIFSTKELQKEQNDVVESQRQTFFHSDKEYCLY